MAATEGSGSYSMASSRSRTDRGRRGWSNREEDVLISGLKEIIKSGWRSQNGFRPGYLGALEKYMAKALPGTDLKAMPHINSKIHTWKRYHASLFSMLSKSGIGLNTTTKELEATDEAWDAYVKADGNAKGMRNRSWPLYDAWCEVFGKDRATGETVEGFTEAVNNVLHENVEADNLAFNGFDTVLEGLDETPESMSVSKSPTATSSRTTAGKKRKTVDTTNAICDLLGKFCASTEERLRDIASRIGYDFDVSRSRKEVWDVVSGFVSLTMQEKLRVSSLLVQNMEHLELFFSLPTQEREEFALMKLAGHI